MSIGIRLHDTVPGTLEERVTTAKAQGFQCAHVALSKLLGAEYMEPGCFTPGLAAYLRRAFDGLDIAVLGCYLTLAHPDESLYRQTLEKYVAHLRLASWLGGCVVGSESNRPNADQRYAPEETHSEAALTLLIERLRPVVSAAEKLGATFALEPVYTHIVSTPRRAKRVLDAIGSPNLRIILDPVNLLSADNFAQRATVLAEALELLGPATAVVHLKDSIMENGAVRSLAPGLGEMDYQPLLRYFAAHKPHIQMTLEDTTPENAERSRRFVAEQLALASDSIGEGRA